MDNDTVFFHVKKIGDKTVYMFSQDCGCIRHMRLSNPTTQLFFMGYTVDETYCSCYSISNKEMVYKTSLKKETKVLQLELGYLVAKNFTDAEFHSFSELRKYLATSEKLDGNPYITKELIHLSLPVYKLKGKEEAVAQGDTDTSKYGDFLKYEILTDSTVMVVQGNYSDIDSIRIPAKIKIGEKEYCVTTIGEEAFSDYIGLKSIELPSTITSIGEGAFWGCIGLKNIELPSTITSIGEGAFWGCKGLKSGLLVYNNGTQCYGWVGERDSCVHIELPTTVRSIGEGAFFGCSVLKSVEMPEGIRSIGEGAFFGCSGLKSVEFPSSVTYIGEGAFAECRKLKSIAIPSGITSIRTRTFQRCSNLRNVKIPSGVVSIGYEAFYRCRKLRSAEFPLSMVYIGDVAFAGCEKLNIVINNTKEKVKVSPSAFKGVKSVKWKGE